jgi:hypothetical protein
MLQPLKTGHACDRSLGFPHQAPLYYSSVDDLKTEVALENVQEVMSPGEPLFSHTNVLLYMSYDTLDVISSLIHCCKC